MVDFYYSFYEPRSMVENNESHAEVNSITSFNSYEKYTIGLSNNNTKRTYKHFFSVKFDQILRYKSFFAYKFRYKSCCLRLQ